MFSMAAAAKVANSLGEEISQELLALMARCKIPDALRSVLAEKDFLDCHDISLLGESEKDVIDAVKEVLPSGLVLDVTLSKNIKTLWGFCCAAAPNNGATGAPAVQTAQVNDDEAPLPEGVPEAIEKAWVGKYGFHLSGARLLIGSDYNRVYNCLNKKKPIELPKMNPEQFRLQNEGVTGESKGLFLSEDGHVSSHKKFFCEIVAHDMLWWKVRAFLGTICYLTVLRPGFFDFQHCENLCDALHDVILAPTANGQRLSLSQCKVAWLNMISDFHVRIFQSGCTLQSITEIEMSWKSHWAWHMGSAGTGSSSNNSGYNGPSASERRLQSLSDKIEGQMKTGKENGRWRGGKRQNNGDNAGQKRTKFNADIPKPPQGGKAAGRGNFTKKAKKGRGKGGKK